MKNIRTPQEIAQKHLFFAPFTQNKCECILFINTPLSVHTLKKKNTFNTTTNNFFVLVVLFIHIKMKTSCNLKLYIYINSVTKIFTMLKEFQELFSKIFCIFLCEYTLLSFNKSAFSREYYVFMSFIIGSFCLGGFILLDDCWSCSL